VAKKAIRKRAAPSSADSSKSTSPIEVTLTGSPDPERTVRFLRDLIARARAFEAEEQAARCARVNSVRGDEKVK
jgi:hypothetical protein